MKKGLLPLIAGLLMIMSAFGLVGYNIWDDYRSGSSAEEALDQLVELIPESPVPEEGRRSSEYPEEIEYPDYVLNPDMDMPIQMIDGNAYVGIVSIPAIDIELPVLEEWSSANLKIAPCRYSGNVYQDDLVLCAHNYNRHFGYLRNLKYGDIVTFTDVDGHAFSYKVTEIETLRPNQIKYMTSGDWDLTLFTCNYSSSARVTVRCTRILDSDTRVPENDNLQ